MLDRVTDWRNFSDIDLIESTQSEFRMHGSTGRPLGNEIFLENIERIAGRTLRPQKSGRENCIKAMARMARTVIPGIPHHVIQRGVRRLDVFKGDEGYQTDLY